MDPHARTAGSEIGRYRLVALLGEGTFADVWLARDARPGEGGRSVVLKLLRWSAREHEDQPWPSVRRELAAALHLAAHPRVLLASDVIPCPADVGGRVAPCLVLEDARGVSLAAWLSAQTAARPETLGPRITVVRHLLEALAHTHAGGVAHRDVAFGNVLVSRDGPPSARLIDFGASQVGDESALPTGAPGDLRPIQPPPYGGGRTLAEEQRRDVYAFAVLATMTLLGRHPLTDDWRALRAGVWAGPADPHRVLPRRPVASLAPWAKARLEGLDVVLDRCLAADPALRPASALEVLQAWP